MQYDFDKVVNRKNTSCSKWDYLGKFFGNSNALPMWVADMDFEVVPEITNAIKKRADHRVYGYTERPESYYDSIIKWIEKRHGWKIQKDWISSSPGVVPALSLSILSFTQPGDKVIIQPPIYPPFFSVVKNTGRQIVENKLKFENGRYVMDFDDLESKIDSRVKLLLLCNPHNPVGRVWEKDELKRLGEICLKHNILVVSDEIHSDIIYNGHKHIPIASLSDKFLKNTITCMAPSKTFNIAGLSTSLVLIPDRRLYSQFENTVESMEIGMGNLFGLTALEAAYTYGEEWLKELLQYLEGNLDFIEDYLKKHIPEIKMVRSEGTYLLWLDCRELGLNQKELVNFMVNKANVALNDGCDYIPDVPGFMRLNFGTRRAIVEEGLKRIERALKEAHIN